MWIFTTKGFYSVVADAQKPGRVLVRARCKADIWNLYRGYHHRFAMTRPKADERRDYRWRLSIRRKDFARLAAALAHEVTYYNFKEEVHRYRDQDNKAGPYMEVWSAMRQAQRAENPPQRKLQAMPPLHLYPTKMNPRTKTQTILAAIALLCAPMPAADNGTGKIVVYYSGSFISGAHQTEGVYLVTTGGHQEVQLHANRYHEFVVAPGRHTLIAHHVMSQDAIEVQVKNGETVYVEDHPSFAHWNFEVSEDQAHAKLRVSQLKPQN